MLIDLCQMLCSKRLLQLLLLSGFSLISLPLHKYQCLGFQHLTTGPLPVHWAIAPPTHSRYHCQISLPKIATLPCHPSAQKCFCKSLQIKSKILGLALPITNQLTHNTKPSLYRLCSVSTEGLIHASPPPGTLIPFFSPTPNHSHSLFLLQGPATNYFSLYQAAQSTED